jgi:hypothetical protein
MVIRDWEATQHAMSLRPAEPQMTATPTLEDIEASEQAHGFASFDRCRIAERRTRIARRSLGDGRITPSMLMRQGLPSVLAEAYCLLLYGPQQSSQLRRGAINRKAKR